MSKKIKEGWGQRSLTSKTQTWHAEKTQVFETIGVATKNVSAQMYIVFSYEIGNITL